LLQEIGWIYDMTGKLKISHLHMGGGSPTALNATDFSRLLNFIHERYDFLPDAEIAVEIDPRTLNEDKISSFVETGVTRASLGVQDFSLRVQEAVNRVQPYSLVKEVTEKLRDQGIHHINFDLMYGLPLQTVESVRNTAELALTLEPDRLAVFGYAHVPWMKKHQNVLSTLPMANPDERFQMFNTIKDVFTSNEYQSIGIDHFARVEDELSQALQDRTMKRNFQGYTTDRADTLLGFGLSSISTLPQGYLQNTSRLQEYKKALNDRLTTTRRGITISEQDKLRRELISELMCFYDADLSKLCAQHKIKESFKSELATLKPLIDAGMVEIEGSIIRVKDAGKPYIRTVCATFDQYIKSDSTRFSLAV
jgi:oxygen-independent coproporphyrinogen-3 oxidase